MPDDKDLGGITEQAWRHEFDVLGTFWYGKMSGSGDFEIYLRDGDMVEVRYGDGFNNFEGEKGAECALSSLLTALMNLDATRAAAFYQPEGADFRVGFFLSPEAGVDAQGREKFQVSVAKTSADMNPFEYLVTLYQLQPNFKENVEGFVIGSAVQSRGEKGAAKQYEGVNPNRGIAILLYGENAVVSGEELNQIAKIREFVPYVRWMGIAAENLSQYGDLDTFTSKAGEPMLLGANKSDDSKLTEGCRKFVDAVVNKFGDSYAQFHLLYEHFDDPAQRRFIVESYCTGQLDRLTLEHKQAHEWLNAVDPDAANTFSLEISGASARRNVDHLFQTHYEKAYALLKSGDFDGAAEHFKRLVDFKPNDTWIHSDYAVVLKKIGQPDAAKVEAQAAYDLDNTNSDAKELLGL
ncbi:tetratricopeptide repeat protein [Candidatus Woesearchaeota archaeon]|nr:tetratricopeptide repeat protein [Candidatus Woesearchaeota archaeon]